MELNNICIGGTEIPKDKISKAHAFGVSVSLITPCLFFESSQFSNTRIKANALFYNSHFKERYSVFYLKFFQGKFNNILQIQ